MQERRKQPRLACVAVLPLYNKPHINMRIFQILKVTSQFSSTSELLHPCVNIRCSKEITEQQAVSERYIKDYRSDPFEEVFDDVIDSNFFYTERSSFRLGREASEGNIVKENDNFTTFVSDAEFATWSERSSSVSEDSEVGTPYQALEDSFGANLAKLQSYAREEPCSGFAISSGWSSTFFPHETEQ